MGKLQQILQNLIVLGEERFLELRLLMDTMENILFKAMEKYQLGRFQRH